MKRFLSLVFFILLTADIHAQIGEPRTLSINSIVRGVSSYRWRIFMMTDEGVYYWGSKVPDMGLGAYVCSPLGNRFFLVSPEGDLIQYDATQFQEEDQKNLKMKDEKFVKLFMDGEGQELYGLTSLGKVTLIPFGSKKQPLSVVAKGQSGLRIAWNYNVGRFLLARGKQLYYNRLNGKPGTTPVNLDRPIISIRPEESRYEVLVGLDNGKVVAMEQDLKNKKWTLPVGTAAITSMQYHPKDHYLFVGDVTGKLYVYDLRKKKFIFSKKVHAAGLDLRIVDNASGLPELITNGADKTLKVFSLAGLAPDYHRIVKEVLEAREEQYLKLRPSETNQQYEQRTTTAALNEYLSNQRNLIVDSLATRLRPDDRATIAMVKDSIRVEVKPFPPLTFHPGEKVPSLSGVRLDSLNFNLRDDNDFMPRRVKIVSPTGKTYKFDASRPVVVEKPEIPLELARKIAQEESVIKNELTTLTNTLRKRGELNGAELGVEAALRSERDSLGRTELNLHVSYIYHGAKAEFNGVNADYPSGKYLLSDSKAGTTLVDFMLRSVKEQLPQYLVAGQDVTFRLTGSTDKVKVSSKIPYSNEFGPFDNFSYHFQGALAGLDLTSQTGITQNSQLGFLRTYSVRNYLEKEKNVFSKTRNHFVHFSEEADGIGPEFRKVRIEIVFHDIDRRNAGK